MVSHLDSKLGQIGNFNLLGDKVVFTVVETYYYYYYKFNLKPKTDSNKIYLIARQGFEPW